MPKQYSMTVGPQITGKNVLNLVDDVDGLGADKAEDIAEGLVKLAKSNKVPVSRYKIWLNGEFDEPVKGMIGRDKNGKPILVTDPTGVQFKKLLDQADSIDLVLVLNPWRQPKLMLTKGAGLSQNTAQKKESKVKKLSF